MTYDFQGTAEAIAFEDTMANDRVDGRYRPTRRNGRVVRVRTFGRGDIREVDAVARRMGGVEYVGSPPEDGFAPLDLAY